MFGKAGSTNNEHGIPHPLFYLLPYHLSCHHRYPLVRGVTFFQARETRRRSSWLRRFLTSLALKRPCLSRQTLPVYGTWLPSNTRPIIHMIGVVTCQPSSLSRSPELEKRTPLVVVVSEEKGGGRRGTRTEGARERGFLIIQGLLTAPMARVKAQLV